MTRTWKRLSPQQIRDRVQASLENIVDFRRQPILGLPASTLDRRVLFGESSLVLDAPYIATLLRNPNHIGCHSFGESEKHFDGTQELEREAIRICAEDIFGCEPDGCDGYVASGGTEANIQSLWVYRNDFRKHHGARSEQIGVISSVDAHYSLRKAIDLLGLRRVVVPVSDSTREIDTDQLDQAIRDAAREGVAYWIVVANLGTTMFGSVDSVDRMADRFESAKVPYRMHVDAAFGGFVYPFTGDADEISFRNTRVSSISLDAHKVLQAPYGTGICLMRKGFMENVRTSEVGYLDGFDSTLVGSRSGANAVAVWMILMSYGPDGWRDKIETLVDRARNLSNRLRLKGIAHYRHPRMNIVSIRARCVPVRLAEQYTLIPDSHGGSPEWYKIIVMEHVSSGLLNEFVDSLPSQ